MPCTKINQIYFPYYVKSNCQTFEGYHKDTKHSDCAKNKFLMHVYPHISSPGSHCENSHCHSDGACPWLRLSPAS